MHRYYQQILTASSYSRQASTVFVHDTWDCLWFSPWVSPCFRSFVCHAKLSNLLQVKTIIFFWWTHCHILTTKIKDAKFTIMSKRRFLDITLQKMVRFNLDEDQHVCCKSVYHFSTLWLRSSSRVQNIEITFWPQLYCNESELLQVKSRMFLDRPLLPCCVVKVKC